MTALMEGQPSLGPFGKPTAPAGAPKRPGQGAGAAALEFLAVFGLTPLVFAASYLLRSCRGTEDSELWFGMLFFYAANFVNHPHFAASYWLFYRSLVSRLRSPLITREQSLRLWTAGVAVPLLLLAWLLAAVLGKSPRTLGALYQVMYLLVGWHYAKQAFGVLSVLSARRGLALSGPLRQATLAHSYAGWILSFVHPSRDARWVEDSGLVYFAHGMPRQVLPLALFGFSVTLIWMVRAAWGQRRALAWMPWLAYLGTLWIWTIWTQLDPLVFYAIPALHSLQYLYFVGLLERGRGKERVFGSPHGGFLALGAFSVVLGWLLLRGGPEFFDGAFQQTGSPLGPTPVLACAFVFVNVHHYFLDHAIWRRENPEMAALNV